MGILLHGLSNYCISHARGCLVIAVRRLLLYNLDDVDTWSLLTGPLTVRCDAASGLIKRATLQASTRVPILNRTLPRHQLRVQLASRNLGKLPSSTLIPVRLQTLHPQLQLHRQLLILHSTSSRLSCTTSRITGSLQFMRVICQHYLPPFILELYLCLHQLYTHLTVLILRPLLIKHPFHHHHCLNATLTQVCTPWCSVSSAAGSSVLPEVARISWVASAPLSGRDVEGEDGAHESVYREIAKRGSLMNSIDMCCRCFCSLSCFVPLSFTCASSEHYPSVLCRLSLFLIVFRPCTWQGPWPIYNKFVVILCTLFDFYFDFSTQLFNSSVLHSSGWVVYLGTLHHCIDFQLVLILGVFNFILINARSI